MFNQQNYKNSDAVVYQAHPYLNYLNSWQRHLNRSQTESELSLQNDRLKSDISQYVITLDTELRAPFLEEAAKHSVFDSIFLQWLINLIVSIDPTFKISEEVNKVLTKKKEIDKSKILLKLLIVDAKNTKGKIDSYVSKLSAQMENSFLFHPDKTLIKAKILQQALSDFINDLENTMMNISYDHPMRNPSEAIETWFGSLNSFLIDSPKQNDVVKEVHHQLYELARQSKAIFYSVNHKNEDEHCMMKF